MTETRAWAIKTTQKGILPWTVSNDIETAIGLYCDSEDKEPDGWDELGNTFGASVVEVIIKEVESGDD